MEDVKIEDGKLNMVLNGYTSSIFHYLSVLFGLV